jgi:hypothetical protein
MNTFQIIDNPDGDWQVLLKNNKIVYENHSVTVKDIQYYAEHEPFDLLDEIDFDGTEDEWYDFIKQWEHD